MLNIFSCIHYPFIRHLQSVRSIVLFTGCIHHSFVLCSEFFIYPRYDSPVEEWLAEAISRFIGCLLTLIDCSAVQALLNLAIVTFVSSLSSSDLSFDVWRFVASESQPSRSGLPTVMICPELVRVSSHLVRPQDCGCALWSLELRAACLASARTGLNQINAWSQKESHWALSCLHLTCYAPFRLPNAINFLSLFSPSCVWHPSELGLESRTVIGLRGV